jgi:hypothetical protein
MKLISVITPEEKAALGVRPKRAAKAIPARLADRKGFIPPKLLAFESMIEHNHVGSEIRRWIRSEIPGHRLSVDVISADILDHASRRVMHFNEKPLDALATSAAIHLNPYMVCQGREEVTALRRSAAAALQQHVG